MKIDLNMSFIDQQDPPKYVEAFIAIDEIITEEAELMDDRNWMILERIALISSDRQGSQLTYDWLA